MIVHVNITEQIIEYMKKNIEAGTWKVGEKIPSEKQLTEILGVSRASVRDAIKYFIGQGVLESVHGKGTFLLDYNVGRKIKVENTITSKDCENIQEVLEFRRIIESEACFLAAKKAMPEELKELERYLQKMYDNVEDKDTFLEADSSFHKEIGRISGNLLLEKSICNVFEESRAANRRLYDLFSYRNGTYYHQKILNAMKKGDAKEAKTAMYEHLQKTIERLKMKEIIL